MSAFERVLKGLEQARVARGERERAPAAATPSSSSTAARYDEVSAPGPDGESQRLSKQQFEKLPLENRIRLLVQGTLRFYRGGEEIPPSEAMRTAY